MDATISTLPLSATPKLAYDHSESNITALLEHVQNVLPSLRHTINAEECTLKSHTPHSAAPSPSHIPSLTLFPNSTSDVSAIAHACHARNIAITSFSGGTSLGGALAATRAGGVCIDFGEMAKVVEVHEDDLDVVVQPGVGWMELNKVLEGRGLFFPVDPAPGARIGGMVSAIFVYCMICDTVFDLFSYTCWSHFPSPYFWQRITEMARKLDG